MSPQLPRRRAERRGLRLWPVGTALALAFAVAILVAAMVFFTAWDLLGADGLKPERRIDSSTLFDLVKLSFGVVAGAGALVALVVAYRRQRVDEDGALRDATRLHNERFTTAVSQLGEDSAAVRLGGVHALAGLADDAPTRELRQTCIDVLCAYLRLPYTAETDLPADDTAARHVYLALREVRHTALRLIGDHLRLPTEHPRSWQDHNFDFTGVTFDGGDFFQTRFAGAVSFREAQFAAGTVFFDEARFDGAFVSFNGAQFSGSAVSFIGAVFAAGQVLFDGAEFAAGNVFFEGAQFTGGTVTFHRAQFSGSVVSFRRAAFAAGTVSFRTAEFSAGEVDFHAAEFSGSTVDLRSARFSGGTVTFHAAQFSGGAVDFHATQFASGTVRLDRAEFSGSTVNFDQAWFHGSTVDLGRTRFSGGTVSFLEARFDHGTVNFSGTLFSHGEVDFSGARFSGGTVDFMWVNGRQPMGLFVSGDPVPGLLIPSPWPVDIGRR